MSTEVSTHYIHTCTHVHKYMHTDMHTHNTHTHTCMQGSHCSVVRALEDLGSFPVATQDFFLSVCFYSDLPPVTLPLVLNFLPPVISKVTKEKNHVLTHTTKTHELTHIYYMCVSSRRCGLTCTSTPAPYMHTSIAIHHTIIIYMHTCIHNYTCTHTLAHARRTCKIMLIQGLGDISFRQIDNYYILHIRFNL